MSATIATDRSKNLIWNARKGDNQSITINFVDTDLNPYDVSGEDFEFLMRRFSGGTIFTLTPGNGLTNTGTSLIIDFTSDQLDIEPSVYLPFLKSTNIATDKVMTWLNISFTLNGEIWDGDTTSSAELTVNNGPISITLQITIGGSSGLVTSQYRGDYTDFEILGFPTSDGSGAGGVIQPGDVWRTVFTNTANEINGIGHNFLIQYSGSNAWNSWPINNIGTNVIPSNAVYYDDSGSLGAVVYYDDAGSLGAIVTYETT